MASTPDSDPFANEPVFEAEIVEEAELVDDVQVVSEEADLVAEADEFIHGDDAEAEHDHEAEIHRHFLFFQAMPAWAISTLVHFLILLLLGMITIGNPVEIINVLSAVANGEDGPEIEEFSIEEFDDSEVEETEEEVTEPIEVEPSETIETTPIETPMEMATTPVEMADFAADMAPAALSLQTLSSMSMQPMSSRSADMKKKLLKEYGGTESSESAVTEALKWLSRHQIPSGPTVGAWTFQHNAVCRNACGNPGEKNYHGQLNAATSLRSCRTWVLARRICRVNSSKWFGAA